MSRVTGFTAERMQTIEDTCIVNGAVLLNDLILTQRNGTQINAGNVRGPQGIQGIQGVAATIDSATATGLAAGAAPTVGLGGTPQARTFQFGIPKGDKGDKGDQGIQGVQGVDGVQGSSATPAGTITLWASDVAPVNWLICDGSAVSRTTYASLFATIGTKYGAGDGVNTFNLPNLKGQTPVGKDTTQTEFAALNQKGGEKTHLLTTAEMPAHNHGVTDPQHSHPQNVSANPGIAGGTSQRIDYTSDGVGGIYGQGISTGSGVTNISIQNTGGGAAHNVLQPYTVVNFIIKYTNGDAPNDSQLTQRVSALETFASASPAGTVTIWGGDTAPTNWMLCDGSAISRTTYASLFSAIGTKYGAGDGSTTFNLPNFKGRTPTGLDATQTEFNTLGKTGGEKTHTQTIPEIAAHQHTMSRGTGHPQVAIGSGAADTTGTNNRWMTADGGAPNVLMIADTTGSGTPFNVLSPYLTVNFIIKVTNGDTQGDSQLTQRVSTLESAKLSTSTTISVFSNNFTYASALSDQPYIYRKNGYATISGTIKQTLGFTGGVAFTIPVGFRPIFNQRALRPATVGGANAPGPELRVDIGLDGTFSITKLNTATSPGWDSTTWIMFTLMYPVE